MTKKQMQELVDKFEKWDEKDFSLEEQKLLKYYGEIREMARFFVCFSAGYQLAKKEGDEEKIEILKGYAGKDGFYCTCKGKCDVDNRTKNGGSLECHCRYLKKKEAKQCRN